MATFILLAFLAHSFYVVDYIVSRANTEDLMLLYSLPAFTKGDPTAFLSGVARANQLVKKVKFSLIYSLLE